MNINDQQKDISWWQPVLFAAMAGAMAWGIRGQYGHETGAMIAGLLVFIRNSEYELNFNSLTRFGDRTASFF